MHTDVLWELVHWFSLPVLPAIVFLLFRRKAPRRFPLFSAYIVTSFLVVLVRMGFHSTPLTTYYYVYWGTELLVTVLVLFAICELFLMISFAQFHKIVFYRYLFIG